jgi:hypothetical protein
MIVVLELDVGMDSVPTKWRIVLLFLIVINNKRDVQMGDVPQKMILYVPWPLHVLKEQLFVLPVIVR